MSAQALSAFPHVVIPKSYQQKFEYGELKGLSVTNIYPFPFYQGPSLVVSKQLLTLNEFWVMLIFSQKRVRGLI